MTWTNSEYLHSRPVIPEGEVVNGAQAQQEARLISLLVRTLFKDIRQFLQNPVTTDVSRLSTQELHSRLQAVVDNLQQLIIDIPILVDISSEKIGLIARQSSLSVKSSSIPDRAVTGLKRSFRETLSVLQSKLAEVTELLPAADESRLPVSRVNRVFRGVAALLSGTGMLMPSLGITSFDTQPPDAGRRSAVVELDGSSERHSEQQRATEPETSADTASQVAKLQELAKGLATIDSIARELRARGVISSETPSQATEPAVEVEPADQELIEFVTAVVPSVNIRADSTTNSQIVGSLTSGETLLLMGVRTDQSLTLPVNGEEVTTNEWYETSRGFIWAGLMERVTRSDERPQFVHQESEDFIDSLASHFGIGEDVNSFAINDILVPEGTNQQLRNFQLWGADSEFLLDVQSKITRVIEEGGVVAGENDRTQLILTVDRNFNEVTTSFRRQQRDNPGSDWQTTEVFTINDSGEWRSQEIDPLLSYQEGVLRLSAADARAINPAGFNLEEGDYVLAAIRTDLEGVEGRVVIFEVTPVNKDAEPDPSLTAVPQPVPEPPRNVGTQPANTTQNPLVTQPAPESAQQVAEILTPEATAEIRDQFGFGDDLILTLIPETGQVIINTPKDIQGYVRARWENGQTIDTDPARTRVEELMEAADISLSELDELGVSHWDPDLRAYVLAERRLLFTGEEVQLHIRPNPTSRNFDDWLYFSAGTVEYEDIGVTVRMENPFPGLELGGQTTNFVITPLTDQTHLANELRDFLRLDLFGVRNQEAIIQLLPFLVEEATPAQREELDELFRVGSNSAILERRTSLDDSTYIQSVAISLKLRGRLNTTMVAFAQAIGVGLAETQDIDPNQARGEIQDRINELFAGRSKNNQTFPIGWWLDADYRRQLSQQ